MKRWIWIVLVATILLAGCTSHKTQEETTVVTDTTTEIAANETTTEPESTLPEKVAIEEEPEFPPMPPAPAMRISEPFKREGFSRLAVQLQYVIKSIPAEFQGSSAEKWKQAIIQDYKEYTPYRDREAGCYYVQFVSWDDFYERSGLMDVEMPFGQGDLSDVTMVMQGEDFEEDLGEDLPMPYGILMTINGERDGTPCKYMTESFYQTGEIGVQVWTFQFTTASDDQPNGWDYLETTELEEFHTEQGKMGYVIRTEGRDQFARSDVFMISDTVAYFIFIHGPWEQEEAVNELMERILAVY